MNWRKPKSQFEIRFNQLRDRMEKEEESRNEVRKFQQERDAAVSENAALTKKFDLVLDVGLISDPESRDEQEPCFLEMKEQLCSLQKSFAILSAKSAKVPLLQNENNELVRKNKELKAQLDSTKEVKATLKRHKHDLKQSEAKYAKLEKNYGQLEQLNMDQKEETVRRALQVKLELIERQIAKPEQSTNTQFDILTQKYRVSKEQLLQKSQELDKVSQKVHDLEQKLLDEQSRSASYRNSLQVKIDAVCSLLNEPGCLPVALVRHFTSDQLNPNMNTFLINVKDTFQSFKSDLTTVKGELFSFKMAMVEEFDKIRKGQLGSSRAIEMVCDRLRSKRIENTVSDVARKDSNTTKEQNIEHCKVIKQKVEISEHKEAASKKRVRSNESSSDPVNKRSRNVHD